MSVLKWIVVVGLGLAGLGSLGFGLMAAAPLRVQHPVAGGAPKVALRAFPGSPAVASAKMQTAPKTPGADAGSVEPHAADAGKVEAHPAPDAGKVEVHVAPDAGKAAPDAGNKPAPVDAGAVVRPPPNPLPPPPPRPGAGEAELNLRASDTADVFLDGKKIGASPLMGLKVKAGPHKVRFDCYDAAGNTTPGQVQPITLAPDENKIVEFTCPASE